MDILKELQSQCEQVEVVTSQAEATRVEFEANRFKTAKVEERRGTALRVLVNGRLGFSASSDDTVPELLLNHALESAAFGDEVPVVFPGALTAAPGKAFDPAIVDLPVARLVDMGREVMDLLLAVAPDAQVNVSAVRAREQTTIRNQAGAEISFQRSPLSLAAEVIQIQGDDVLILYDEFKVTVWDDAYPAFAHRLADKLRMASALTTLRSGTMPVLFSPAGSLVLGLPLLEGLNGKNVLTGVSPMGAKVGQALFDARLTVLDDGTLDGRAGSAPYDDEGVPHRRNALIERGVVSGFLYDLKTAAQAGAESTGNGSRGLFSAPVPTPTNLLLAGGDMPLAEILAGVDEGLLVEDVLGLGQGNITSGAFSNPLSLGFKIEKGEIVGRVKNVAIAGNVYELLKDLAAVSRETQWVYGNLCLPYILLPEMNVVAQG